MPIVSSDNKIVICYFHQADKRPAEGYARMVDVGRSWVPVCVECACYHAKPDTLGTHWELDERAALIAIMSQ
jgi:hypothetical protein